MKIYTLLVLLCFNLLVVAQSMTGKRVLITAPNVYALRLQHSLEKRGAEVFLMPLIETIVYDSIPEMSSDAAAYDYVVLPSRNAIRAFDNQVKRGGQCKDQYPQIYVIGKDAEYLSTLGYSAVENVTEPSMMGILEAIRAQGDYAHKKMLLVAPEVKIINEPNVVPQFVNHAKAMAIDCEMVYGYTTQPIVNEDIKQYFDMMQQGEFDLVAFSSGGELFAMADLLEGDSIACPVACFGPYTASNAALVGIAVDMVSDRYSSFDDYATSIAKFFSKFQ